MATKKHNRYDSSTGQKLPIVVEETETAGEYMDVAAINRVPSKYALTIAAGANISNVVDLRHESFMLLAVPAVAGLEAGTLLQPEYCDTATGTFLPLTGDAATLAPFKITPHATLAMWCPLDPNGNHLGGHFMRLHAVNAGGADVNQTSIRNFTAMGKG